MYLTLRGGTKHPPILAKSPSGIWTARLVPGGDLRGSGHTKTAATKALQARIDETYRLLDLYAPPKAPKAAGDVSRPAFRRRKVVRKCQREPAQGASSPPMSSPPPDPPPQSLAAA